MPGLVELWSWDTGEWAVNDEGAIESHLFILYGVSGWSCNTW